MRSSRVSGLATAVMLLCVTNCTSGCALLIGGAVAGGAAGTVASVKESRHEEHAPMTYVGTVLANVVYVPAKVMFAGAGAATSGVAYLVTLGSAGTSHAVWKASVGGNYVVTPAMVEGRDRIHFVG